MKGRFMLPVAALIALALLLGGCGDSGESSSTDPATLAPADAPVFIEGTLRPKGELKSNVEEAASTIAGIKDLGGVIAFELESSARDSGESFDFDKEVEPWLGEQAGMFFKEFDGEDFTNFALAVQTTDADAAQEFIDKHASRSDEKPEEGSYEGNDFYSEDGEGPTVGMVGDFLVIAESSTSFKDAVDASNGDSLAGEERFEEATSSTPQESLADVYVDVGGLIRAAGDEIDQDALEALKSAGIDPRDATAVLSVVPGPDRIEVDISSDLAGEDPPSGNASELLASLPGNSFAAFAVSGFGEQLQEALDNLDASGIPGEVPPHKLKSTLKEAGVDLDAITGSLEDAGVFAVGSGESSLGGALVLTTDGSDQAANTISNLGLLLRSARTPGVTALSGKATGFSIRSPELGSKPAVIATQGDRVAIGYGLPATLRGLAASGGTLSDNPGYDDAVAALGNTPISGFVDGPAALHLGESFLSGEDADEFEEAKPYLEKVSFIAIGSDTDGDLATAKLVIGLEE